MGKLVINGGRRLYGAVDIQGSKNAVLPIFAAAILADGISIIHNVPVLADVDNMKKIIEGLGAKVVMVNNTVQIDTQSVSGDEILTPLAKELRSSIFLLGAILGRHGKARVAYPGGCDIGIRPIDIHIKALREMNVVIEEAAGCIYCDAANICSAELVLDYPSVGATENIILAAALTKGKTTITNAAREPEIVDLQDFINRMGGKIRGAGTPVIEIEGVEKLNAAEFTVMSDRIVAGTIVIGAAITGGEVVLKGCNGCLIGSLLSKLNKTSCNIKLSDDIIEVRPRKTAIAVDYIETQPYPGFPTDLQAPIMALQAVSSGVSVITENIFENRFRHVAELAKMGAKIKIRDKCAIIRGVKRFHGAEVTAQDLRGGAALVLAGLNAEGITAVDDIYHIDRGYEQIEKTFTALGADIRRT